MSASTMGYGGVRAQTQMKAMSFALRIHLFEDFSVTVSSAQDKFDDNGKLLDEHIREKVKVLVTGFADFASN